jgi:hypothetical protein
MLARPPAFKPGCRVWRIWGCRLKCAKHFAGFYFKDFYILKKRYPKKLFLKIIIRKPIAHYTCSN